MDEFFWIGWYKIYREIRRVDRRRSDVRRRSTYNYIRLNSAPLQCELDWWALQVSFPDCRNNWQFFEALLSQARQRIGDAGNTVEELLTGGPRLYQRKEALTVRAPNHSEGFCVPANT